MTFIIVGHKGNSSACIGSCMYLHADHSHPPTHLWFLDTLLRKLTFGDPQTAALMPPVGRPAVPLDTADTSV